MMPLELAACRCADLRFSGIHVPCETHEQQVQGACGSFTTVTLVGGGPLYAELAARRHWGTLMPLRRRSLHRSPRK